MRLSLRHKDEPVAACVRVGMRMRTLRGPAGGRRPTDMRSRTSELSTGRAMAAAFHLGAAVSLERYKPRMMEHTYLRPGLRMVTAGNAKMEIRSDEEIQRPVEGSKSR